MLWGAEHGHESTLNWAYNIDCDIDARDQVGCTPLIHTANGGNKSVVELLIRKGAHMNLKLTTGLTPVWDSRY